MGLSQGKPGLSDLGGPIGDFGSIPFLSSPNFGKRSGVIVDKWIWHYTAGPTAASAISWLRNKDAKASAHFVIGREGDITQLVRLSDAAWHAGEANISNANGSTIGCEMVNVGIVYPDGKGGWQYELGPGKTKWTKDAEPMHLTMKYPDGRTVTAWWVPYTNAQQSAMIKLVNMVERTIWGAATKDMRGHEDIAPNRKSDPGPLFPWSLWPGQYTRHFTTVLDAQGIE